MNRCSWATSDPLYCDYHDHEWGVPLSGEQPLFEFLTLETFQAGLSWITILRKREQFREAFDDFHIETVASYADDKVAELLQNAGIVRNKLKINAAINNAQRFLEVQKEIGSFYTYSMQFVHGKPKINHWKTRADVPATSKESDAFSKDLKKRGFKFVGSTVMYAYMQATGMVMDHTQDCYRYAELK